MRSETAHYFALQRFLVESVPAEITAIEARGGINDLDIAWLHQEENDDVKDFRFANVLARGDAFLLYPQDEAILRQSLLVLRKAIAVMAFFPGGVRVFGYHFSTGINGFTQPDKYGTPWWERWEKTQSKSA